MSLGISLDCPICFDPYQDNAMAGSCLHNLCDPCYTILSKSNPIPTCPTCRDPMPEVKKNCQFLDVISLLNAQTQSQPASSIRLMSYSPPPSEPQEQLERAIGKAASFLSSTWAPDSLKPSNLTSLEIDILWDQSPGLCHTVLSKIYDRLSIFGTESCTAIATSNIDIVEIRHKILHLKAASRKAAAGGDAIAQYCLGHCLFNGIQCAPNYEEAVNLFKSASMQGLSLATYSIGLAYEFDKGVEGNLSTAVRYYKNASKMNCAEAIVALAKCYLNAKGTKKKLTKGLQWFEVAAEMGNIDALMALGDYYSKKSDNPNDDITLDFEKATDYYTKAFTRGHSGAQKDLERCLLIQVPPQADGCSLM